MAAPGQEIVTGQSGEAPANGAKPAPPDGLPTPRRYWAAATVMTGISLSVLDTTIANVALPTIAVDLNASPAQAVWIVNAYNLAVVMMLLPLSALAERIGFRRMFTFGLMLFTLASLGCALAGTLWQLTAARVFQGIGAASLMCMFGGLVRNIYPLKLLGRGISINATTVAIMSVLGPTIGSAILSVAPWPWIFAVNLPICALTMLGLRHLPEVPRNDVKLDWISALLCMLTLGVFISGVDMMGMDLLRGIGLVAIATVIGFVLVRRVGKQPAPLVPVDLLRIRPLAFAVGASACTFAAQMASYVSLPFYFQQVLGRPYLEVGMLMGAWPVGTALIAPLAGRLSDRYSAATLSGIGAAAMVVGMLWLAALPATVSNWPIVAGMFVAGMGFGFFQTPNNRAMLSAAPRSRSGAAGGLQATTRVFGQSFGTALVAIAFSLSLAHGPGLALVLGTICAGLAVVVNTVRFSKLRT
ncbi:MFS transporter [Achromobacter aegrifaciens]|uniref:MFS transporter n=1 Tax=Achromobacter aegrifaciens TaxID=1287736 RepID=UPI0027B94F7A|nr:MFS transporter [Achromobacter aegrifaciens]WLW62030.1 MFS transporter [Achromobacter aegrifaciens]